MAKKVFLEVHSEAAYFTLIGISCHLREYRLTHLLNKKQEFAFAREQDLSISYPGKNEPGTFSFFFWKDEDHLNSYSLIANRSEEHVLVPEIKQLDFIMVIEGEFSKTRKDSLIKSICSIPNVLTAYEIKLPTVRNFGNLLSDIEIHLMNIVKGSKPKFERNLKKERSI